MRKWVIFAIVLSVIAGAALLAVRGFDAALNAQSDRLAGEAEALLGRDVSFDRIGMSLGAGLAVEVDNLRIAEDPAFDAADFLHVDRAHVVLKLLPALFGRYEVRRVELEAPRITLIRDASRFNFDSLARSARPSRDESTGAGGTGPRPDAGLPIAALPLLVAELQVRNASIRFVDRRESPPSEAAVDDVDFSASSLDTTDRARVVFDASRATIEHRAFRKPAGVAFTLTLEAARRPDAIEVAALSAKLGALDANGRGRVALGAQTADDFELDVPATELAELAPLFPPLGGVALSGRIAARLHAAGKRDGSIPDLQGQIEMLDVAAARQGTWNLAVAGATVTLANGSAVLPPTEVNFSGMPIRLEAKIEKLAEPAIQYLAHAAEFRPAALFGNERDEARAVVLNDVALNGAIYVNPRAPGWLASIVSPKGTIGGLEYQDLRGVASLQETVVLLRRLQIDSGDGSILARGQYDTAAQPPTLDLHTTARGIDIAPLFSASRRDGDPTLRGRLQASLDLRGAGSDRQSIVASLSGEGKVRIADGAIEDFNVAESALGGFTGVDGLAEFVAPKVRERHPEIFSTGDTRFDSLTASLEIAGQRVTSDDLLLEAPDYTVRGAGTVGFDRRVELDGKFLASEKLAQDVLASVREARFLTNDEGRLEIPFRLEGKLPRLRLKPDAPFVAEALQKALSEGLDRLLQPKKKRPDGESEAAEPAEELLEKGLKKLFGD